MVIFHQNPKICTFLINWVMILDVLFDQLKFSLKQHHSKGYLALYLCQHAFRMSCFSFYTIILNHTFGPLGAQSNPYYLHYDICQNCFKGCRTNSEWNRWLTINIDNYKLCLHWVEETGVYLQPSFWRY